LADNLIIQGAKEHNLKNIDVTIPRDKLVVFTGLSGSGKSSLAFDTIYAEGQRRYIESFSAYARQFIGELKRPDVDNIIGLSPVISIEQRTANKNPRSTVGTITEIYDYLRLLYARVADAYSYVTGEKMVRYTEAHIIEVILNKFNNNKIIVLAPVVKARKGHYRDLFEQIRRYGFIKVRVDGEMRDITVNMSVDRYKIHNIEIVIDRIDVNENSEHRVKSSVQTALKYGKGVLMILEQESEKTTHYSKHLMCPTSGISYDEPEPNTFSFNSPYGACPHCSGLGEISAIDINKLMPDKKKTIRKGGITAIGDYKNNWIFNQLIAIGEKFNFTIDTSIEDIPEDALNIILYGSDEIFKVKNEFLGVYTNYSLTFNGIVNFIVEQNNESSSGGMRKWAQEFMNKIKCPECNGARLKKESLYFKINNKNITEIANFDIVALQSWVNNIEDVLSEKNHKIAQEIIKEIKNRINFILEIGLDYLTLNRNTNSLSGGESQRIRLATQIGTKLVGVLYILDEPSIGLHQRDNLKLINNLKELRDNGNSVIVVEHDKEMILSADHVIDLGPKAGIHGGNIVAEGSPDKLKNFDSLTAQYIRGEKKIKVPEKRRKGSGEFLKIYGASGNNLKNLNVSFPLGKMLCITGVSGSGKSSLVNETLYPVLSHHFYRATTKPLPYKSIEGIKFVDKVIEIDQSPIGRTPRSNPATYTKVFDDIRKLFTELPESKIRGYSPGRFSFNVKGGRCEVCQGAGMKTIEMNFLPDVYVNCEACQGKRYNRETLEIRYKGKSINDILNLNIEQAVEFFENIPSIIQKIKTLKDVGLGYITLGQQSTTLSGGEAQRVKLAAELSKKDTGKTLYILDEPTTGLHFDDIRILLDVLNRLADKGNTVIIIEHNMEIIKSCDHIIDLGMEGGDRGGYVICEGSPEEIAENKKSYTAQFLKKELVLK
jgi:excinuclease ABC subunit A